MTDPCPSCGEDIEPPETKLDGWGFPYEWDQCEYCGTDIVSVSGDIMTYSNYLDNKDGSS